MFGSSGLSAEIVGVFDQAPREVSLPDAIDDHPRWQRISRIGEPAGPGGAPARRPRMRGYDARLRFACGTHDRKKSRRDFFERLVVTAAGEPMSRRRQTLELAHDHAADLRRRL